MFDGVGWNSLFLGQNETLSHTFTEAGTFAYTFRIHPTMNSTVTVTNESANSRASTSSQDTANDDPY